MNKKINFILGLGIIILCSFVVGVATIAMFSKKDWLIYKNEEKKTEAESQTDASYRDWLIYKNEEMGIEFEYPINIFYKVGFERKEYELNWVSLFDASGKRGRMRVSVADEVLRLNDVIFIDHTLKEVEDFKKIDINGENGYFYIDNMDETGCASKEIIFPFIENTFKISFICCSEERLSGNIFPLCDDEKLIDEILSTFKFNNKTAQERKNLEEFSYITNEKLFYLTKEEFRVLNYFNARELKNNLDECCFIPGGVGVEGLYYYEKMQKLYNCGENNTEEYFQILLSNFLENDMGVKYNFNHIDSDEYWQLIIVPNRIGYIQEKDFFRDFSLCYAGGNRYPLKVSEKYLLFQNDGRGTKFFGKHSDKIKKFVESTIELK